MDSPCGGWRLSRHTRSIVRNSRLLRLYHAAESSAATTNDPSDPSLLRSQERGARRDRDTRGCEGHKGSDSRLAFRSGAGRGFLLLYGQHASYDRAEARVHLLSTGARLFTRFSARLAWLASLAYHSRLGQLNGARSETVDSRSGQDGSLAGCLSRSDDVFTVLSIALARSRVRLAQLKRLWHS